MLEVTLVLFNVTLDCKFFLVKFVIILTFSFIKLLWSLPFPFYVSLTKIQICL